MAKVEWRSDPLLGPMTTSEFVSVPAHPDLQRLRMDLLIQALRCLEGHTVEQMVTWMASMEDYILNGRKPHA